METSFGLQPFTPGLLEKLAFLQPPLKNLLEYSRGFDETTDLQTRPCYIYTGRGPSKASFHLGHLPGLQLCLALQAHFKEPIEFMISDDEKIFRDKLSPETMAENVAHTLAQLKSLGFTSENTKFRINSSGISAEEYSTVIQMLGMVSVNTLNHIFGEKDNLGEYFYPLLQILPSLSTTRQCIVVAGVDQDPFFRLARELARRLKCIPPIVFYTRSVPGLDGSEKMSTSVPESMPIFLDDSPELIREKVSKIRKVGAGSLNELFEKGATLEEDIPVKLLSFFDTNPANLSLLTTAYTKGLCEKDEKERLLALVPEKGVKGRDGRVMVTSLGVREYLTNVLVQLVWG
jgi:tryptophanyl-tRNA synthetase